VLLTLRVSSVPIPPCFVGSLRCTTSADMENSFNACKLVLDKTDTPDKATPTAPPASAPKPTTPSPLAPLPLPLPAAKAINQAAKTVANLPVQNRLAKVGLRVLSEVVDMAVEATGDLQLTAATNEPARNASKQVRHQIDGYLPSHRLLCLLLYTHSCADVRACAGGGVVGARPPLRQGGQQLLHGGGGARRSHRGAAPVARRLGGLGHVAERRHPHHRRRHAGRQQGPGTHASQDTRDERSTLPLDAPDILEVHASMDLTN
jgi:hypothetical protein